VTSRRACAPLGKSDCAGHPCKFCDTRHGARRMFGHFAHVHRGRERCDPSDGDRVAVPRVIRRARRRSGPPPAPRRPSTWPGHCPRE
jgi:hypothetical protein